MKTEFLSSLQDLTCERIEMSLHGEQTPNPFWNLIIDAEPVGRVYLQDQPDHEQIRAGFMADSYAQNFGNLVSQVGLEKLLTMTHATLFAHKWTKLRLLKESEPKLKWKPKRNSTERLKLSVRIFSLPCKPQW